MYETKSPVRSEIRTKPSAQCDYHVEFFNVNLGDKFRNDLVKGAWIILWCVGGNADELG
jgi:hypothetical protein